jgi:hypothetical protein
VMRSESVRGASCWLSLLSLFGQIALPKEDPRVGGDGAEVRWFVPGIGEQPYQDFAGSLVPARNEIAHPGTSDCPAHFHVMDEFDLQRYRRQAEECRAEAAKADNPLEVASWLRLADDFDKLADARLGHAAGLGRAAPNQTKQEQH